MNKINNNRSYICPQLAFFAVAAEQGFSVSDEIGYPGENPDFNDFGEF